MVRLMLAIALALCVSLPAVAGTLFEIETQDHAQNPPRAATTRVAVEGRRMTMEIAPGAQNQRGGAMLFHGDRREMAILNHDDRSFMVFDAATMRQLAGQMNQAFGQMQEAMRNVPDNQRAAVEQMMKSRGGRSNAPAGSPTEVRRMNQTAEVYGYPCQLYEVRRDGRKIRDLWVTDWNNIEGGRELAPAFADLAQFQQELMSALPQMGGGTEALEDNPFTAMREINGFPVATRDYNEDGSVKSETALRSAKSQRLGPETFQPPAGYQQRNLLGR